MMKSRQVHTLEKYLFNPKAIHLRNISTVNRTANTKLTIFRMNFSSSLSWRLMSSKQSDKLQEHHVSPHTTLWMSEPTLTRRLRGALSTRRKDCQQCREPQTEKSDISRRSTCRQSRNNTFKSLISYQAPTKTRILQNWILCEYCEWNITFNISISSLTPLTLCRRSPAGRGPGQSWRGSRPSPPARSQTRTKDFWWCDLRWRHTYRRSSWEDEISNTESTKSKRHKTSHQKGNQRIKGWFNCQFSLM